MKRNSQAPIATHPLRRRAETRLRDRAATHHFAAGAMRTTADTQRLIHELQVHQVELEMQNEELRKTRDAMEAGLEKYSELYDFAPVGYLTLDPEGAIHEANLTAATLLGIPRAPLMKKRFGQLVTPADRLHFHAFLKEVFESRGKKECDVTLLATHKPAVEVRIRANRSTSGETCRLVLSDITQQKRAETLSAQLAAIVTSSSDAIVGKDLDSIVTSWNAGAEKLFGYSSGEMVGRSISRLIPYDRHSEEEEIMSRIRKGESMVHFETMRVARDGRRFDLSVAISPIKHAGGKIVGASEVARDVTEHKQTENKVRVSEIRYRRLFEAAHDGVLLLDPDTRKITDANPFMTKLLGYGRAQLIGKELFEIGLLKDEVASQEMFRKLRLKREARYEDLPLESKTGRHQEVEVVANLYQENGHSVIQCNIRDITARKRSEEALRQSEDRYRTLFDSIDEGFCVIEMRYDRRGRPNDYAFLEVNPSFERQTGIRRATGRRIRAIAPQMEALWFERYGAVARTGVAHRFVMEAKPLGRWFDVYAFRLGGADSRKVAVLFRDVTERKRTDQALSEARAQLFQHAGQLEKQIATRTAQLTTTNRRLQNSVTATLKGKEEYRLLLEASQAMQEKLRQLTHQIIRAQEEERKEISRELHDEVVQSLVGINVELSALVIGTSGSVDAMRTKIARTQRLVEHSVTAVHRFARGLRPAVLDDLGLIPALHAYCKALAERKKLKIHLTVFNGVERLDDAGRTVLFRVAQEALNNVARHAHATRVTLAISEIPGAVRMEIADNGSAFPVEKILSAKNPNRLGLVGMKERIEMVGGQLTIVSTPGSGTTVRTEIPFTPPPLKK